MPDKQLFGQTTVTNTVKLNSNIELSASGGDLTIGGAGINSIRRSAVKLEKETRQSAVSLENSTRKSAVKLNKSFIDTETDMRKSAVKLETSIRKSAVSALDSEVKSGEVTVNATSTSKQFPHGLSADAHIVATLVSSSANAQIYAIQQGAIDGTNVTFHFSGPLSAADSEDAAQTWKIRWIGTDGAEG